EDKSNKLGSTGQPAMPTRGKLHNVIVSVFDPVDAPEPTITAKMNNAAFDTDNFRIATESYVDEHGNTVEADQVPVVVRGRDYDFDGRGLVIRWNERDRKLQLLEIAHGESLTVKNASALSPAGAFSRGPATRPAARGGHPGDEIPQPVMLASADPHAFVLAAASKTARKKPSAASTARRHGGRAAAPASRPTTLATS